MTSITQSLKPATVAPMVALTLFAAAATVVVQGHLALSLMAVAVAGLLLVMLLWPELGTCLVLFAIYSNIAVAFLRYRETGGMPIYTGGLDNGGLSTLDTGMRAALLASIGLTLAVPLCRYVWAERESVLVDRPLALMWFYLAALLLSAVFCVDPWLSSRTMLRFVSEGLVLYFLVINVVRSRRTLHIAMWTLLIAGGVMAGLSVFQEASGTQDNIYWGLAQRGGLFAVGSNGELVLTRTRAAGPIGEQNRYAQILLVLLPFAAFFLRYGKSHVHRVGALAAGCLIFAGIVLTFSRGAFVALIVLLIAMGTTRLLRWKHLFFVVVFASAYVVIHEPDYLARLSSLSRVQTLITSNARPTADDSARTRLAGNIASFNVFLEHPLLGVGRGVYPKYYATPAVYKLGVRQTINYPSHNLFLNLAAESGLLGLGLFLAIIASIAAPLWRNARSLALEDPKSSDLAVCFFLVIVAYLASGMFVHLAYERYLWLLLALSSAATRVLAHEDFRVGRRFQNLRVASMYASR